MKPIAGPVSVSDQRQWTIGVSSPVPARARRRRHLTDPIPCL